MTYWSLRTAYQTYSKEAWRTKGEMRLSSSLPSGSKTRPPPLSTVSSTPKTTPSTWSSACRPNWAKVNYFTDTCSSVCDRLHYQPSGYLLCPPAVPLCLSALSRFSLLCLSFPLLSTSSDGSLPEDWWQIWHHQFQSCLPGRWSRPSRDAPCQRPTARPASPQHLCRLQTGTHFEWSAGCIWVSSTRSQQGGTEDPAVKWTGEQDVSSWE